MNSNLNNLKFDPEKEYEKKKSKRYKRKYNFCESGSELIRCDALSHNSSSVQNESGSELTRCDALPHNSNNIQNECCFKFKRSNFIVSGLTSYMVHIRNPNISESLSALFTIGIKKIKRVITYKSNLLNKLSEQRKNLVQQIIKDTMIPNDMHGYVVTLDVHYNGSTYCATSKPYNYDDAIIVREFIKQCTLNENECDFRIVGQLSEKKSILFDTNTSWKKKLYVISESHCVEKYVYNAMVQLSLELENY